MFTKVSERLYLAFFVKMRTKTREQHLRGNEQRRVLRSMARQAVFIAEYIQVKYPEHYNEAASFFNTLNRMYPVKPELRKTKEFREFKAVMSGEQLKQRKRPIPQYRYIQITESSSPQTSIEPESPSPQTPIEPQTSIEPESPSPQTPIEPQTPTELESPSPQTPIEPETPVEPESPQPQTPIEPETPTELESPSPQTPIEPESSPPQTPIEEHQIYNDNMVLRIPLLGNEAPQKSPPTVTTETIEIITEEIVDPLTLDDIPPEKIEELINQLRQDPDLQNIFTDIEEQLEFEQIGMDIDIPEHDLLEDELFEW